LAASLAVLSGNWHKHLSTAPGFSRVKYGPAHGKIIVEQIFLSAGGGTFQFRFGRLESRPNPQAGKPALQLKLTLALRLSMHR
jgi:hypothetical protein